MPLTMENLKWGRDKDIKEHCFANTCCPASTQKLTNYSECNPPNLLQIPTGKCHFQRVN